jgi:hypothetical protein
MDSSPRQPALTPPALIPSIKAGFDSIASHIALILFPLVLDLVLWLAPHLQVKTLLEPWLIRLVDSVAPASMPELLASAASIKEMGNDFLLRFNLFSSVSALPVGVPSLMNSVGPLDNPFGQPLVLQVQTPLQLVIFWVAFFATGLALGSLFFTFLARFINRQELKISFHLALRNIGQTYILTLILIGILLAIGIPAMIMIAVMGLVAPGLLQIGILFLMIVLIWLLLPLIFAPHGIFLYQQTAVNSILNSIRLVRFFLPGTSLFVLVLVLLDQVFKTVWSIAPSNSWLMLAGIVGHSFTISALLASSFAFYHKGSLWMKEYLRILTTARTEA